MSLSLREHLIFLLHHGSPDPFYIAFHHAQLMKSQQLWQPLLLVADPPLMYFALMHSTPLRYLIFPEKLFRLPWLRALLPSLTLLPSLSHFRKRLHFVQAQPSKYSLEQTFVAVLLSFYPSPHSLLQLQNLFDSTLPSSNRDLTAIHLQKHSP